MAAVVVGVLALAAALMFSLLVFAVLLAGALVIAGYIVWKTRRPRRFSRADGRIIEGQARAKSEQERKGQPE